MHLTPHPLKVEKNINFSGDIVWRYAMNHYAPGFPVFLALVQQIQCSNDGEVMHDRAREREPGPKRDLKLCRLMKQLVSGDQKYDPMTEQWYVTGVSCNYITPVAFGVNRPFWPLRNESDKMRYWHFLVAEFGERKVRKECQSSSSSGY